MTATNNAAGKHHIFDGMILSPKEFETDLQTIGTLAPPDSFALQCTFSDISITAEGYHLGSFLLFPEIGLVRTSIQLDGVQFRALVDVTTMRGQHWLRSVVGKQRLYWLLDDADSGDAMVATVGLKLTARTREAYRRVTRSGHQPLSGDSGRHEVAKALRIDAEPSYVPDCSITHVVVILVR